MKIRIVPVTSKEKVAYYLEKIESLIRLSKFLYNIIFKLKYQQVRNQNVQIVLLFILLLTKEFHSLIKEIRIFFLHPSLIK
jgi:hypothetical protein